MSEFDPRLHPYRRDVAAAHLRGQVSAERFVEGTQYEVIEPIADLRRAPSADAPLDTQALYGERVTVYELNGEGWAWAQLETDSYVGWLPENALESARRRRRTKSSSRVRLSFPRRISSGRRLRRCR